MSTATLMTVEEFANMETTDTERYELVDGELIPMSSGKPIHNAIRDGLGMLIGNYLAGNPIGKVYWETDCRTAGNTVRCPDLSVFLAERLRQVDQNKIPIPFAPEIAVEVLSPSEKTIGTKRKVRDYLGAGGKEVWVVDHSAADVFVHTSAGIRVLAGSDVLDSPLLPGFAVAVSSLFDPT